MLNINYHNSRFQNGFTRIDMLIIFVLVIPGQINLPRFVVEIGPYNKKYTTCRTVKRRNDNKPFDVECHSTLKGRTVKIKLLERGRLSICKVAVYGNYG